MRLLVAMSGGVDSSVAAALMREAGHDVVGVTLKLWSGPNGEAPTAGCCTVSDAEDARRVAAQLDIPYYVLDYTDEFSSGVVNRFVSDYASGRTPNPCIECNRTVKFDQLLGRLADYGCEALVTGHYARNDHNHGRWRLRRGVDMAKDQSYVLSMLGQNELQRVLFPVGEMTKPEVRRIAAGLGLRTAVKPESMDICFVGQRDYRSFLHTVAPEATLGGEIVDTNGQTLGRHDGVAGFTIGQRRGLGIAMGEPRYVVDIDTATSTVIVGRRHDLSTDRVELASLNWVSSPHQGDVLVQYRAHGEPVAARVSGAEVVFQMPQEAVAAGQTMAFYLGDEVLGGGLIAAANRVVAAPV